MEVATEGTVVVSLAEASDMDAVTDTIVRYNLY